MDDKTRGVNDQPDLTGRADETRHNADDAAASSAARAPVRQAPPRARAAAPRAKASDATNRNRAADGLDTDTDRRTREIQAEIAETREELSETIDAIQEKLRPSNLVSEATDKVKTATTERVRHMAGSATDRAQDVMRQTRETATDVWEGARQNPIPALMIGAGIAWLLIDRARDRSDGYSTSSRRPYRGSSSDARYRPGYGDTGYYRSQRVGSGTAVDFEAEYDAGDEEESYAAELRHVGHRAAGMADEARETLRRTSRGAQNGLRRLLRENPLLVGAAAMVAGAAVGAALPETERENEWLGETRDSLVDRAQEAARSTANNVQEAAKDAVGDVVGQVTDRMTGGGTSRS